MIKSPKLSAAVAMAIALLASSLAAHAQAPAPRVTVSKPLAERVTQWDEFSGRFEAVQRVEVRARVSGFIEKIHFRDGQIVKAGDLLFSIDKRPFQIAVESAKAAIARAKAQVSLQQNEVQRARPLAESRVLTERTLDQRSSNLAVAKADLAAAEASLRSAQLDLEWAEVRAPISGRISDRRVDVGALISGGGSSGQTTLLTTIVSIDPINFVFDASEADYLRYARLFNNGNRPTSRDTANPVRIRLADETTWSRTGRMDFVDNSLNPRSGTIRGRAIVKNPNGLLSPGLFGRLQLYGGEFDALLVPDRAIVSDQTRKIVFVVDDAGKVSAKVVRPGQIAKGLRVIQSGLDANDRVVIDGIANPAVRPGATVTTVEGEIKSAQSG
ncbi:MAG: efflux RND transporter periplasmic adaptor subunit [Pseudomonadota bacterium]